MSLVVDTSVTLAWCFEDEHTPAVLDLLGRVIRAGAIAPLLWPLEALNGLQIAERRRRVDAAKRLEMVAFLRELPITLDRATAEQAWEATRGLAERFRLTLYDATYLELAQRRRLPLASLDGDLRSAATALGVEPLGLEAR